MENLFPALMGFIVVPAIWGLSTAFLSNWLRKMVDKGRLPKEYALPDFACAAVVFGLFFLIASIMKKISG